MHLVWPAALIALLSSAVASADESRHRLEIVASAAGAPVASGRAGRRSVNLPDLNFRFQLLYRCAAPHEAASLSLTVADTQRFLTPLPDAAGGTLEARVELDRAQIAPVAIQDFCTTDDPPEQSGREERPLTLPAVLSAAASLRCRGPESGEVIYAAAPLDVVLTCEREPPNEDAAREGSVDE